MTVDEAVKAGHVRIADDPTASTLSIAADSDLDGVSDVDEAKRGSNPNDKDTDDDGRDDFADVDANGDGICDDGVTRPGTCRASADDDVLDERGDLVARPRGRVATPGGAVLIGQTMAGARPSPETNPTRATVETFGGISATDGWCATGITAAATTDLIASIPARITAAEQANVRFLTVIYKSGAGGGADTRACVAVNPTGGTATPCNALDGESYGVIFSGGSKTYAIARDPETGTLPSVLAGVDTGVAGVVCVEVGY